MAVPAGCPQVELDGASRQKSRVVGKEPKKVVENANMQLEAAAAAS